MSMSKLRDNVRNLYTLADRLDQWEESSDKADQEDVAMVTRSVAKCVDRIAVILGELCDTVTDIEHRMGAMKAE